jgi:hypothetical protein
MAKQDDKSAKINGKEPVFIIRPVSKNFGLDYLHIMLIALVIVLVVLAYALSGFKQGIVVTNCQYGANANATCNSTVHNSTQALSAAERALAAYSDVNTSLSLIPYFALVNQSEVNYLPQSKQWLVTIPYKDPLLKGTVFNISLLLYDSNLTLATSFLQTIKPQLATNNSVVGLGAVQIHSEPVCSTSIPIPVYVITDPYSPNLINTLNTSIAASRAYGSKINVTYHIIFSGYSEQYYSSFGVAQTQALGQYLECASKQQDKFPQFVSNLSLAYNGRPLPSQTLSDVEMGSGLNTTQFNGCMDNVTTILDIQAQFASLYNTISTPSLIVNCRYYTIPQSLNYAINYSLSTISG